jgi:hypothetical protein
MRKGSRRQGYKAPKEIAISLSGLKASGVDNMKYQNREPENIQ